MTPQDVPAVTDFLRAHSEYVMFPLNNLTQYGLDGDAPFAPRMWRNAGGDLTDLLSVTKAGMVMPYLPSGDFAGAAAALTGRSLVGLIGPAPSVIGTQSALNLLGVDMELDTAEQHFSLRLSDVTLPNGDGRIVVMNDSHRKLMTPWLIGYHIGALGMHPDGAARVVPSRITREIDDQRRVILFDGDTPVATTAFSAALAHIVQVGGVYTPPPHRGRGYARLAVALHLKQAHQNGAQTAVLSADDPSAIAAYSSVGFRPIGEWAMKIFNEPQVAP